MKLLVIGGTGGTGRQVVQQALDAGHEVTLLARDPSKVSLQHPHLTVVAADVTDLHLASLTRAIRGHDAVISAIGRGLSFKSEHLIERSVPNILAAMSAAGVKRLSSRRRGAWEMRSRISHSRRGCSSARCCAASMPTSRSAKR
jgi:putative NADH-flavin reductase